MPNAPFYYYNPATELLCWYIDETGAVVQSGDLSVQDPGSGLRIAEGDNAKQGVATLIGGTVTVANTSVTADSRIFLTAQTMDTILVPAAYAVTALTPGESFTITSSASEDTSVIAYQIFEQPLAFP